MMLVHRQEDHAEKFTDRSSLTHGQHEMFLHGKAQAGMKPQESLSEKLESAGHVSARPSMLPLRKQHGDSQLDKVGGRPVRQSRGTPSSTKSGNVPLQRLAPRGRIETPSYACYSDGESCLQAQNRPVAECALSSKTEGRLACSSKSAVRT
jgi:hypothetical protein